MIYARIVTRGGRECVVRSTSCEMKQGDVIPIRMRRPDERQHGTQVGDIENIIVGVFGESTAQ